jgi:thymidylate synthase (FAD)
MTILPASARIVFPTSREGFVEQAKLIEYGYRVCYESTDKITEDSWKEFVSSKLSIKPIPHETPAEHGKMTVEFIVDRGVSHELVRHRLMSPSQSSTRYCNYSKDKFGKEIKYIDIGPAMDKSTAGIYEDQFALEWIAACEDAERHYMNMIEMGAPPQLARSVLNNSTATKVLVSANFREWRHIFRLRALSKAAHPQMREVMIQLYQDVRQILPEIFDMGDPE